MAVKTVQYNFQGQTYNLVYNAETGKYEATVTAPAKSSYSQTDHKYGGSVVVEDDAGNVTTVTESHETLGESLKVRVLEKNAPVVAITYPTASAFITNEAPEITFNITDDDSGADTSTIALIVDGAGISADVLQKTPIAGGYKCTYTPSIALADGEHTITVNVSDHDGNAAEQQTVTFTVDTVAPTLSVTNPTEGFVTNEETITVTGSTNDVTSKPVTVTVNGEEVAVNSDGTFSKNVTLISGANAITVVATDKAGKQTTIVRNVTLDTGAPVIVSIEVSPNPIDCGKTFVISVEATD